MTRSGELEERRLLKALEAEVRAERRAVGASNAVVAANAQARIGELIEKLDKVRRAG